MKSLIDSTNLSKLFFQAQFAYFGVTVGANLLAVLGLYFLTIQFLTPEEQAFLNAAGEKAQFLNLLSFLVPITFMIWYFYPTKDLILSSDPKRVSQGKAKILNAPVFVGAISFLGWAFGVISANLNYLFTDQVVDLSFRFRQILTSIFSANLCFVFSYYSLDFLNQKYFIPKIFSNEKISDIQGTIRISIVPKFLIFFAAVALTPMLLLINIILSFLKNSEISIFLVYVFVIAILSTFVGLFLTFLIANSFARPIISMQKAARKIENGDYEVHLKNVSNDELGSLEDAIGDMAQGLEEKEFIKDTFGKLVDPKIRDYLLNGNVELGGQVVEAAILFVDIRGFTALSEKLLPEKVVQLLNLYFEQVSEDIVSEGGLVNKFIGDGILAIFGAPIPLENSSLAAVRAGTKIRETVRLINQDVLSKNLPNIDIGLGIHTGQVLAGNIGSKSRMEYTVIGDTVNIASRVESLCKEFGKDFLITKSVKSQISENGFNPIFLESVKIRGKENVSEIYWL